MNTKHKHAPRYCVQYSMIETALSFFTEQIVRPVACVGDQKNIIAFCITINNLTCKLQIKKAFTAIKKAFTAVSKHWLGMAHACMISFKREYIFGPGLQVATSKAKLPEKNPLRSHIYIYVTKCKWQDWNQKYFFLLVNFLLLEYWCFLLSNYHN